MASSAGPAADSAARAPPLRPAQVSSIVALARAGDTLRILAVGRDGRAEPNRDYFVVATAGPRGTITVHAAHGAPGYTDELILPQRGFDWMWASLARPGRPTRIWRESDLEDEGRDAQPSAAASAAASANATPTFSRAQTPTATDRQQAHDELRREAARNRAAAESDIAHTSRREPARQRAPSPTGSLHSAASLASACAAAAVRRPRAAAAPTIDDGRLSEVEAFLAELATEIAALKTGLGRSSAAAAAATRAALEAGDAARAASDAARAAADANTRRMEDMLGLMRDLRRRVDDNAAATANGVAALSDRLSDVEDVGAAAAAAAATAAATNARPRTGDRPRRGGTLADARAALASARSSSTGSLDDSWADSSVDLRRPRTWPIEEGPALTWLFGRLRAEFVDAVPAPRRGALRESVSRLEAIVADRRRFRATTPDADDTYFVNGLATELRELWTLWAEHGPQRVDGAWLRRQAAAEDDAPDDTVDPAFRALLARAPGQDKEKEKEKERERAREAARQPTRARSGDAKKPHPTQGGQAGHQ